MQKNRAIFLVIPLLMLVLLLSTGYSGKSGDGNFETFIVRQDSLMVDAYEKRDIAGYSRLMQEAETRYALLNSKQQKAYMGYMATAYYNFTCLYSLENQVDNALSYFEKAIKHGYTNYSHIKSDTDLDNIRDTERYKTLIQPLRKVGDYLWILQHAGAFNNEETLQLPAFTYQSAADPELTALRTTWKLDSVAGTGTEVSRIINLMHWIHDRIQHNGNRGNPDEKNAMSLLRACAAENRSLNCRGLATVLNEMYLSMGFASRLVTCLPKDSLGTDMDCHVINAVYSRTLGKWLWMDPTNDAYVMDENNNLLSIQEVRSRLVLGMPLKINETANWNHKEKTTVEHYLYYYMAKNLYMLQCATESRYDYETAKPGKTTTYIQLIPLDYRKNKPGLNVSKLKQKRQYQLWFTNNETAFWAAPVFGK
jgi:Transglutaminase-like superfamily